TRTLALPALTIVKQRHRSRARASRNQPRRMRFGHQRVLVRTFPGPVDLVGGNALKITLLAVKAFLLHEKPDLPLAHIIALLRIIGVGLRVVPRPSGCDHQTALVAVSLLDHHRALAGWA